MKRGIFRDIYTRDIQKYYIYFINLNIILIFVVVPFVIKMLRSQKTHKNYQKGYRTAFYIYQNKA